MASEHIQIFNDANFQADVLQSDKPVLVDFWASWCAPCRAIAPSVEELAKTYEGKIKVGKLNIDDDQGIPQQYGIRSIPTLLVFKGGKVVDQIVGAVPKSKIEDALKKAL
jgi:thioredoxin 1